MTRQPQRVGGEVLTDSGVLEACTLGEGREMGGERKQRCDTHLINISAKLFASAKQ